jgi:mannose-6-phosphate isomerase-like protein (cupin superfamily)
MRFNFLTAASLILAVVAGGEAYAQAATPGGTPLRLAPASEPPMYEVLAPGLFGRSVYSAQAPDRSYGIEVFGLLVGPGRSSEPTQFDGDAVLLVRSGRGLIAIEGKNQELSLGSAYSIAAGQTFHIENFDEAIPISLRAVILRSAR